MCVNDCDGGVVVICDGGIDHNVPKKPPLNKVSVVIVSSTILPHIYLIYYYCHDYITLLGQNNILEDIESSS